MEKAKRRLAAILAADVAGYSRLMGSDERATVATLNAYREIFREHVAGHDGRVVDTSGDSVLAVFDSIVEAVACAANVQAEITVRNADLAEGRQMLFRIGVNLGDVIEQADGTLYGDGVNVAARLEGLAEPGGICVSQSAYMQAEGKVELKFQDIGEHKVKNISRPVRVFRLGGAVLQTEAAEPALGLPDRPSIAILPFNNMSGDPEQEYFSDGITEDLITELSRFRELFVIARNTTFTYKNKAVNVEQVGRELGVRYVLEGSIRKAGNRVRITAQLIDAATGGHIWAERYDRVLEDIFELQDEITRQMVGTLGVKLEQVELEQSMRKPTDDLLAYDYVLRSLKWWHAATPENHADSRDLLEKAVALDPNYAQAHAHLANAYVNEFVFGFNQRPDPLERGTKAAKRAIELDPSYAFGHYILARCYYYSAEDTMFEASAETALSLNPNDADALADIGGIYAISYARLHEGAEMARQAMRLNPHHPGFYGFALIFEAFFEERYDEALAELRKSGSDYWAGHVWFAVMKAKVGDMPTAKAAAEKALSLKPDFTVQWYLEHRRFHPSFHETFRDGAQKAGLPLG